MPEFEYYEFLNWICVHYFIYAVSIDLFCTAVNVPLRCGTWKEELSTKFDIFRERF